MGTTKVKFSVSYEKEVEVSSMRALLEEGSTFVDEVAAKVKIDIDDTMNGGLAFQVNEDTVKDNPVVLTPEEIQRIFDGGGWGDTEITDKW